MGLQPTTELQRQVRWGSRVSRGCAYERFDGLFGRQALPDGALQPCLLQGRTTVAKHCGACHASHSLTVPSTRAAQTCMQAHEVEHELQAMDSHFVAEVHRLAAAAQAARHRTAALQAAAQQQVALAGGWQRRVELMEDTHEPLNQADQEKRHRLEAQFRFRVVRFSTDA